MIRCLVVDDEPLALDILEDYIKKVPFLTLVKTTISAIEGLSLVQSGVIDLVFLDVQMPELTGIQFLKIINGKCDVILTTAYSQYALDGYDLDVVDYLLKPIAFDRFYKAAQKVLQTKGNNHSSIPEFQSTQQNNNDFIFVKTEHKIQKIYLEE
jgi:response regulator of citrate/malate metabolism